MSASHLCDLESDPRGHDCGSRASRWSVVAERTVYFGHQSVGTDVVAGVEGLIQEHAIPVRVVQTLEPATMTGPAFVHFLAGQSRDYASKNAAILRLLESPTRARKPIVLLKYCYGDIKTRAHTAKMFDAYQDTIDTIQAEHPDVTVVHSTIPLTSVDGALKSGTKRFFGLPSAREGAMARHRYNELVRSEFKATDAIFDIARLQSTQSDGVISGFNAGGSVIETPAPANTYYGGHLNAGCRKAAAEALLDVLSDVIEAGR